LRCRLPHVGGGREALEVTFRFEGKISRIRAYGFCPDTIRAVGAALGVHVRTGIDRAPTPRRRALAGEIRTSLRRTALLRHLQAICALARARDGMAAILETRKARTGMRRMGFRKRRRYGDEIHPRCTK